MTYFLTAPHMIHTLLKCEDKQLISRKAAVAAIPQMGHRAH